MGKPAVEVAALGLQRAGDALHRAEQKLLGEGGVISQWYDLAERVVLVLEREAPGIAVNVARIADAVAPTPTPSTRPDDRTGGV